MHTYEGLRTRVVKPTELSPTFLGVCFSGAAENGSLLVGYISMPLWFYWPTAGVGGFRCSLLGSLEPPFLKLDTLGAGR